MQSSEHLRVGVIGYGWIGRYVSRSLGSGGVPGIKLVGVSSRKGGQGEAQAVTDGMHVLAQSELINESDLIVETASADALPGILRETEEEGKALIAISTAGLLRIPEALERLMLDGDRTTENSHQRVVFASGAVPGLDIIRAARIAGGVKSVRLISTFSPESLGNVEYVRSLGFDPHGNSDGPVLVTTCTAREAGWNFPEHLNVAVSIGLAGVGLDETLVEVWSDPKSTGPRFKVELDSAIAHLNAEMVCHRNKPGGRCMVIGPTVIAALRRQVVELTLGS